MANGESNGLVTDDFTWPRNVKSWLQCALSIAKSAGDAI